MRSRKRKPLYRLREIRKDAGLTQSEMAKKLNQSYHTYFRFEKGYTYPDVGKLKDAARVLRYENWWELIENE